MAAIREAIAEEMQRDDRVFVLGEDIGTYGGAFGVTRGLLEQFGPDRIIDTPISENSFVGVATGTALTGMKPIVEIMFMDFITLAMDQIVNHMAKIRYIYGGQVTVPVVIRTPSGGGRRYGSSHSQALEAWFMHVPGLHIAVPSSANDAKHLLKHAIRDPNPWIFIEGKRLYADQGEVAEQLKIPVGRAAVLREGDDCTLISYGKLTSDCRVAASALAETGIAVEHIDLRTLSPLDSETLVASVRKTRRALVVEEGTLTGGIGAEISARITEDCFQALKRPVARLACADTPTPVSSVLEDFIYPDSASIAQGVESLVGTSR
jgi:pyruvate dehydrogenase E1 component beta subunit